MPALPPAVIDDALAIGGDDINARKVRTRMTVEVLVNARGPYRFIVDSGADSSVVGWRIAREQQLPAGRTAILNGITASARVERVLVSELTLGPSTIRDLELPVLKERDLGGEGMLGIDALAQQRLMMDFEKRVIKIEDSTRNAPRMDGEFILVARRRRGQLILTQVRAANLPVEAVRYRFGNNHRQPGAARQADSRQPRQVHHDRSHRGDRGYDPAPGRPDR